MKQRRDRARELIAHIHAADPAGAEAAYAERILVWLQRLLGEVDECAELAGRCQHLERWVLPRDSYPADRPGYLAWRKAVHARQGERAAELLQQAGYEPDVTQRIDDLVAKRVPRSDALSQALEDAACLDFLGYQLRDFAAAHPDYDDERWLRILRRSAAKMSPAAIALIGELDLPERIAGLLARLGD